MARSEIRHRPDRAGLWGIALYGVTRVMAAQMDLSRFDATPLIAFTTKETDYGRETDGRIPPECLLIRAESGTDGYSGRLQSRSGCGFRPGVTAMPELSTRIRIGSRMRLQPGSLGLSLGLGRAIRRPCLHRGAISAALCELGGVAVFRRGRAGPGQPPGFDHRRRHQKT